MMSTTRDLAGDGSVRSGSISYAGVGPSPSPGQYNAHTAPHFQPVTPVVPPPQVHQTPVPIPHPPQHSLPPTMPMRSMQYQQQQTGLSQSYVPNFTQSPAPSVHQQQMNNSLATTYSQVPVPSVSRGSISAAPVSAMTPGNIYNPPRPPEVYALPDNLNESFPPEVRECFQHDAAGRVLFFTAPPWLVHTKASRQRALASGIALDTLLGEMNGSLTERGNARNGTRNRLEIRTKISSKNLKSTDVLFR